jgi:hypothetical protein
MQPFESHRPATLEEVLAVLGRSSSTKMLAGARDLFPAPAAISCRGCGFLTHPAPLDAQTCHALAAKTPRDRAPARG